jgi:cell division protein FtsN
LQRKYASIIGNHSPSVRKADLGTKGVWYRLLIGPVSEKSEAEGLCEQLKGAGMKGCFARKD